MGIIVEFIKLKFQSIIEDMPKKAFLRIFYSMKKNLMVLCL